MLLSTPTRLLWLNAGDASPAALIDDVRVEALAANDETTVACLAGGEIAAVASDGAVAAGYYADIDLAVESALILAADPLELLLGTAGARIFRFAPDRAISPLDGFDQLDCRPSWYTPWGGPPAVRCLARSGGHSHGDHDWIYADVHVGSIMRSPDHGTTWEPVTPDLHEDVHQVATTPARPAAVYANTADAVYVSADHGTTWTHRATNLPQRYGRALAVHPHHPDILLASTSRGPHQQVDARLHRSIDAGLTWTQVAGRFPPSSQNNIDTFHLTFDSHGTAWCAVDDALYVSRDSGENWAVACELDEPIELIACS